MLIKYNTTMYDVRCMCSKYIEKENACKIYPCINRLIAHSCSCSAFCLRDLCEQYVINTYERSMTVSMQFD